MYGVDLSYSDFLELEEITNSLNFKNALKQIAARKIIRQLTKAGTRLFRRLEELASAKLSDYEETEKESDRFPAVIDDENYRHIRSICNLLGELIELLTNEPIVGNGAERTIIVDTKTTQQSSRRFCYE